MKIAIGCDEAGFQLKQVVITLLHELGHTVEDYGCYNEDSVLYPVIAQSVALAVVEEKYERGILICGTGIGMSITANKIPGIRAAVCHDSFSTVRSRRSNNAQIMCMGSRVIGFELAKQLVAIWLENNFVSASADKVQKISEIEATFVKDNFIHKDI